MARHRPARGALDGIFGAPTVGLSGVWNWAVNRPRNPATGRGTGPRNLIDDLERIGGRERKVAIDIDSDLAEKPGVGWARWHLARALAERGADVRVVDLPAASDGAKCGLDDFLNAHGPAAFRLLLDTARPPTRPASGGLSVFLLKTCHS